MKTYPPETIQNKGADGQFDVGYFSHADDMKGKLAGKYVGKMLGDAGLKQQASLVRVIHDPKSTTGIDLETAKAALHTQKLAMFEANLGSPGKDIWPYPDGFFDNSSAKVLLFAGGDYPHINAKMAELKERIGDRLLNDVVIDHSEMKPNKKLTPELAGRMLAQPAAVAQQTEAAAPAPGPAMT